jgi:hypothetical protein
LTTRTELYVTLVEPHSAEKTPDIGVPDTGVPTVRSSAFAIRAGDVDMVPRREAFFQDLRRAGRTIQRPKVTADSARLNTDAIATVLQGAALWLTRKVVEENDSNRILRR